VYLKINQRIILGFMKEAMGFRVGGSFFLFKKNKIKIMIIYPKLVCI
jgi:hypothetical protein